MLLIPDIHINTQYRDQIIQQLSDIATTHPDEDHIVLLWDYVYMFSYDRDALLALYKLLIWRYHAGKTIYVLAWNHDWHGQNFVYEEARQARDIINQPSLEKGVADKIKNSAWAIHFITSPTVFNIDGESVLMMPYMIDRLISPLVKWESEGITSKLTNRKPENPNAHHPLRTALTDSSNKYEQASWRLNLTLEYYTQTHKIDTIIHHYYTADTQFPWLRTQFSYRDVALDPSWCNAWYDIISWHIHHPLMYGRYLCCGSLWTTAANETNQNKYYRIKHWSQIHGYQIHINPHLTLDYAWSAVDEAQINAHYDQLIQQYTDAISSNHYDITLHHISLPQHLTTLSIVTEQQHDMSQLVDSSLIDLVKSAKPKYKTSINHDHNLSIDTESLQTSVIQRKDTLMQYIESKYQDQSGVYRDLLEELQIIDKK